MTNLIWKQDPEDEDMRHSTGYLYMMDRHYYGGRYVVDLYKAVTPNPKGIYYSMIDTFKDYPEASQAAEADFSVFKKADWETRPISHAAADGFITAHHYSKGMGHVSSVRLGLFRRVDMMLMGVAVYMMAPRGVSKRYQTGPKDILALSRLAVAPMVPCNGASYLIGASIRHIASTRPKIKMLITFADGMRQHTGAIYKASNWTYDGQTPKTYRWKDSDGRLVSRLAHRVAYMDANYLRSGPYFKQRFIWRF